jgi:putative DNA primase/helicase|nr:MAG TPA: dsDNA helicase [Caudoviricetes sp.]
MTSFIREKGPRLVETGYPVVPLSKGKKHPTTPNWQNSPLTAQACRQRPEGEGVGVLCGYGDTPICAIDVDFRGTDAEAKALFDALCKAYPACAMAVYRVGRAPKFALLFRAEGRWLKQTTLEYVKNGDESTKSQLEVLGKGQQIVLYHTHPETGLPYSYPYALLSGEPTDVPAAELPLVTYEGVQTLCDTFEKFVESNGWASVKGSERTIAVDADEALAEELVPKRPIGLTIDQIRELMAPRVESWGSYTPWYQDGMRIHHETSGSSEGLALWDELSQQAAKYDGFEEVEKKWATFNNRGLRSLTMWPIAREARMVIARAEAFTEDGLLCRVLRDWGDHLRYAPQAKRWYYFEPATRQWDRLGPEASICTRIRDEIFNSLLTEEIKAARDAGDEAREKAAAKFQLRCLDGESAMLDKLLKNLTRTRELYVDENDMDAMEEFIAVENGLVNLKTRDLVPNAPDALMVKYCNVRYDPSADCPTWRKCVSTWFGSEEVAWYMQKVLGKMLAGRPDEEAFYLLIGDGANGKSSFLETISEVMGGYSKALSDETVIGRKGTPASGHRADIVRLQGARFVYCSETGSGESFRAADLKRISGGDKISARGAYAAEVKEFPARFTLFIATNFAPNMQGADNAMRRRIRLIDFPHDFENDPKYRAMRIKGLSRVLKAERSGIFNWLLEGREGELKEGLAVPKSVQDASNAYVDSHDLVTQWFDERCEIGRPEKENDPSTKDLFESYCQWLESMNEPTSDARPRTLTERLKKLLTRRGASFRFRKSHGKTLAVGIRLKSAVDLDQPAQDDFEDIP